MNRNIRPFLAIGVGLKRYGIHGDVNASLSGSVLSAYGGVEFRHSNRLGSQLQYRYAKTRVDDNNDNINVDDNSLFYGIIINIDVFKRKRRANH